MKNLFIISQSQGSKRNGKDSFLEGEWKGNLQINEGGVKIQWPHDVITHTKKRVVSHSSVTST